MGCVETPLRTQYVRFLVMRNSNIPVSGNFRSAQHGAGGWEATQISVQIVCSLTITKTKKNVSDNGLAFASWL